MFIARQKHTIHFSNTCILSILTEEYVIIIPWTTAGTEGDVQIWGDMAHFSTHKITLRAVIICRLYSVDCDQFVNCLLLNVHCSLPRIHVKGGITKWTKCVSHFFRKVVLALLFLCKIQHSSGKVSRFWEVNKGRGIIYTFYDHLALKHKNKFGSDIYTIRIML